MSRPGRLLLAAGIAASLTACSIHGGAVRQAGAARHAPASAPRFEADLVGSTSNDALVDRGITVRITNLGPRLAQPTCALRALEAGTQSVWSTSMSTPPIPAGASVVIRGGAVALPGARLADLEVACG
jgi:hypothetical protein